MKSWTWPGVFPNQATKMTWSRWDKTVAQVVQVVEEVQEVQVLCMDAWWLA